MAMPLVADSELIASQLNTKHGRPFTSHFAVFHVPTTMLFPSALLSYLFHLGRCNCGFNFAHLPIKASGLKRFDYYLG